MKKNIVLMLLVICSVNLCLGAIAGQILNADGSPSAGTVVYDFTGKRLEVYNNKIMMAQNLPRVITGFDGKFTFEYLTSGKKLLLTRDMENCCTFNEIAAEDGTDVALIASEPARIKGTLLAGDIPIADTEITATFISTQCGFRYYHQAETDSKGRFVFKDVMPGEYGVSVIEEVPQIGCSFRAVATKQMKLTVKAGEDLEIKLGGTDLPYLTGNVKDTAKTPLHGVWVSLFAKDKTESPQQQSQVWSAVTDRKGNYTIYDIPPGEYSVQCVRRLAKNNGSRVIKDKRELTIPDAEGIRPKNTLDISIDKSEFMPLEYGQAAPPIESKLSDGTLFDLSAYRGKVVVLHFYASWCGPCISTMDDFDKLQNKFGDEIVVVGISLDETVEEFNKFISKNPPKHRHLFDGPWKESTTAKDYRVVNVPTSMIIGATGNIEQMDLFGGVLVKFVKSILPANKE